MALRAFKYFAITTAGTPVPLVGTTIAGAALVPGNEVVAQVADSSMFRGKDWAVLVEANGTLSERVMLESVTDPTHVVIKSVANAHAVGAFLVLGGSASEVYIQTKDGNLGNIYIGNAINFNKATGANMLTKLTKVAAAAQPTEKTFETGGAVNGLDISNFWVDGDSNTDQFLVVMDTI